MSNQPDGPRPGRPTNAEKYADKVTAFTDAAADYLPEAFLNLQVLAECHERSEVEYQAAGTITRRDVDRREDGTPRLDAKGKPIPIEVFAFPDLPPETMVVVKRKTASLPPDYKANEYLANRVMGTPRQSVEHSGEGGGPVRHAVTIFLPDNARDPTN